ncbi:unnamed protein product [Linum trigynum]|uniref:Selenoprotein H n=1 Tax=Linum trigynum TaxID=586398 RepID=A0AAV2EH28_9ROSI
MAPKKRPAVEGEKRATRGSTVTAARATRSQTAVGKLNLTPPLGHESSPKKKKAKTPTPKEQEAKPEEEVPAPPSDPEQTEEKPAGDGAAEGVVDKAAKPEDDAEKAGSDGEAKDDVGEAEKVGKGVEAPEQDNGGSAAARTVVIEHCKQCRQFKVRADKVKDGLVEAVPGITVLLNPHGPPRRGCFEVREEGGRVFISLLGMKRPFQPMKDLDMDQVVADIASKLK